ncbi:MAG: nucleoid-associated protein [Acidithiobacillus sp.]|nr:nucleoid-associated protein [Acidithiobacillus sp.]
MSFQNLVIQRTIIHEVFKRPDAPTPVEPSYGEQEIHLEPDARDALQQRITAALGHASHGLEMSIRKTGAESIWAKVKQIVDAPDNVATFISASQSIAASLADAQTSRIIPSSIVVVVYGMVGHPGIPFTCIIKAEPHAGFTRKVGNSGELMLEFLKDLILTPKTKLYKIGAFMRNDANEATVENPSGGWRGFIFDDLITAGNRQNAANYFYDTFLGLAFPSNSAWKTKQFHTLTKDFIRSANVTEEIKSDLLGALTTYLKVDQGGTIQVNQFATTYMNTAELRDAYSTYMQGKDFPAAATPKDISELKGALRDRKVTFSNNIRLTGPAEQFHDRVRMRTIDGDAGNDGVVPKWTEIIVHDWIRDQE